MARPPNCGKCKRPKDTQCICGRPTKMTESTINKLEEAFSYAFTDEEACLYAGISRQTLNEYCKKNPEFRDRKQLLKQQPSMLAKRVVVDSIKSADKQQSNWWLERKSKDEFSTRQEMSGKDGGPIQITEQRSEAAKRWVESQKAGKNEE